MNSGSPGRLDAGTRGSACAAGNDVDTGCSSGSSGAAAAVGRRSIRRSGADADVRWGSRWRNARPEQRCSAEAAGLPCGDFQGWWRPSGSDSQRAGLGCWRGLTERRRHWDAGGDALRAVSRRHDIDGLAERKSLPLRRGEALLVTYYMVDENLGILTLLGAKHWRSCRSKAGSADSQ